MRKLIKFSLVRKVLTAIKKPDNEKGKERTLLRLMREIDRSLLHEDEFNCQYIERKRHEFIGTLALYLALRYLVEVDQLPIFRSAEEKYRRKLTHVGSEYGLLAERPESMGKLTHRIDVWRANWLLGKEFSTYRYPKVKR